MQSEGMNYIIRPLTTDDQPFLWEMLYQALHVPEGQTVPPREMVRLPELARYVQGWELKGDCGFLAGDAAGQPIGAVWLRLLRNGNDCGFRRMLTTRFGVMSTVFFLKSETRFNGAGHNGGVSLQSRFSNQSTGEIPMPSKGLSMRNIKEILRLHHEARLTNRQIGRSLGMSHSSGRSTRVAMQRARGGYSSTVKIPRPSCRISVLRTAAGGPKSAQRP